MRNSSLQLQGPCYPIIFPSVNDDVIIDKSIRRSLDSRASVVKRYVADIGKSWPVLIVCGGLVPLFQSRCLAASYSAFCCCHAMDNRCPFQHAFNIGADSCLWSRHSDDFYLSYSYPHFSCHHPPYVLSWQHQSSSIIPAERSTTNYSHCRLTYTHDQNILHISFINSTRIFDLYNITKYSQKGLSVVPETVSSQCTCTCCRLLDEFFSSHHCSRVVAVEIERSHLYFSEYKVCSSGKTFKG
ncbi:unnamed protein product [Brassica napus]|uniref:(rape) hypothetical protein n=1 Tax=Brassica napus TaxID=3708 RepID=A0A816S2T0_BRANA|nr:unnamed protein product [Brassica napus]